MTWIVAMVGCVSSSPDTASETTGTTGYGPDCAESVAVEQVCACEVSVDVSGVADPSGEARAVVIQGNAAAAAGLVCDGTLTQSQLLSSWEISPPGTDTGAEPPGLTGSLDLSRFDGSALFVAVYRADGTIGAYVFADIVATVTDAEVVLE